MVFRNGRFLRSEGWLHPEDLPAFCDESQAQMAHFIKLLDEFHTDDLARLMWPECFLRETCYRHKTEIDRCSNAEGEEWEPYDWRKLGRTRAYNTLKGIGLRDKWVKKIGPSRWKSLL